VKPRRRGGVDEGVLKGGGGGGEGGALKKGEKVAEGLEGRGLETSADEK